MSEILFSFWEPIGYVCGDFVPLFVQGGLISIFLVKTVSI